MTRKIDHARCPEAVLFDLDGTLVDTAGDFIQVLNTQRKRHNMVALDPQHIRDTVSNGARALTRLAFGGEPGETEFESRRQELLELYLEVVGRDAKLFEGMDEVLLSLESRGVLWGIVTNKPRLYTEKLLDRIQLSHRCSVTVCPDDVQQSKPDPEGLLMAAQTLGIQPKAIWYVGDHERDIQAGQAANMTTVAARYGYIDEPGIVSGWQAHFQIDRPLDILSLAGL